MFGSQSCFLRLLLSESRGFFTFSCQLVLELALSFLYLTLPFGFASLFFESILFLLECFFLLPTFHLLLTSLLIFKSSTLSGDCCLLFVLFITLIIIVVCLTTSDDLLNYCFFIRFTVCVLGCILFAGAFSLFIIIFFFLLLIYLLNITLLLFVLIFTVISCS